MSAELESLSLFCLEVARCVNRVQSIERLLESSVDTFPNPVELPLQLQGRLREGQSNLRERAERLHSVLGDWLAQEEMVREQDVAEQEANLAGMHPNERALSLSEIGALGTRRMEVSAAKRLGDR